MTNRAPAAIVLLLALGIGGCATAPVAPEPVPAVPASPDAAHNSRNSLDWAGTYKGTLPCADCPGIETIVTLRADGTYSATSRYLERSVDPTTEAGRFTWDDQGGTITLAGSGSTGAKLTRYRVGEGQLIRLATDGSTITGPLAQHYVLTKEAKGDMANSIRERYWKLVELRGQPVATLEREPHMILKMDGSRVTGFGGCNTFNGRYTLDEAAMRVSFDQVASTMMACSSGMDVEQSFHQVLQQADNYSLNGDNLTLNRARMAPLARFVAVYMK